LKMVSITIVAETQEEAEKIAQEKIDTKVIQEDTYCYEFELEEQDGRNK